MKVKAAILLGVFVYSVSYGATKPQSSYTVKETPAVTDKALISDPTDGNKTKNATLGSFPISIAVQGALDGKPSFSAFTSAEAFYTTFGWSPLVDISDVTGLFTGTGDFLKADGTTGTPSGLSSLPTAASQTLSSTGVGTYEWLNNITLSAFAPLALNASTGVISMAYDAPIVVDGTTGHLKLSTDSEAWSAYSFLGGGSASVSLDGITDWPVGVTATEVGYIDGVTSPIQAQLNALATYSGITHASDCALATIGSWCFDTDDYKMKTRLANGDVYSSLALELETAADTVPSAFTFTDETDVDTDVQKVSAPVTISGINWASPISVTGDTGYGYSINGTGCIASSGIVVNGDEVAACVTSSSLNNTSTSTTVTIGTVEDTYSVTTSLLGLGAHETDDFPYTIGMDINTTGNWSSAISSGTTYSYFRTDATSLICAVNRKCTSYRSNVSFSQNQKSCAKVVGTGNAGVTVRASDSAVSHYSYVVGNTSGFYELHRVINGTSSVIQTSTTVPAADDIVCLSASGTNPVQLSATVNGASDLIYNDTDANRITTGQPGLWMWRTLGYIPRLDNWTGSDL